MIDALIGGRIYGKPGTRTSSNGKPFVVAKVRAATGNGDDTLLVNVITFSEPVGKALMALEEGDAVSLSGALTPKVWTPPGGEPRPTLDLMAHAITTPYHVTRKRQAVTEQSKTPSKASKQAAERFFTTKKPQADGLDDDLPWATA